MSVSLEIDSIDPLIVLQQIAEPNQQSFYFENKSKNQAIAAIDAVTQLQTCGANRFVQAQYFINSCLDQILTVATSNEATSPHFFCSFSFFEEITQSNYPFSAATVFLPRWQISRNSDRCTLVANFLINAETNLEKLYQDWCQQIRTINFLKHKTTAVNNDNSIACNQQKKISKNFKKSITSCLELIE